MGKEVKTNAMRILTKIKYLMKLSIMNVTNSSMGFTQPKPPELRWSSLLKHLSCREKVNNIMFLYCRSQGS